MKLLNRTPYYGYDIQATKTSELSIHDLYKIRSLAKRHDACKAGYLPYVKALRQKNWKKARAITNGELDWLCHEGILPKSFEREGLGLRYWFNYRECSLELQNVTFFKNGMFKYDSRRYSTGIDITVIRDCGHDLDKSTRIEKIGKYIRSTTTITRHYGKDQETYFIKHFVVKEKGRVVSDFKFRSISSSRGVGGNDELCLDNPIIGLNGNDSHISINIRNNPSVLNYILSLTEISTVDSEEINNTETKVTNGNFLRMLCVKHEDYLKSIGVLNRFFKGGSLKHIDPFNHLRARGANYTGSLIPTTVNLPPSIFQGGIKDDSPDSPLPPEYFKGCQPNKEGYSWVIECRPNTPHGPARVGVISTVNINRGFSDLAHTTEEAVKVFEDKVKSTIVVDNGNLDLNVVSDLLKEAVDSVAIEETKKEEE